MNNFLKKHHIKISIAFISIMYSVGIVQVLVFHNEDIMQFTPFQLLISFFFIYIYTYEEKTRKLLVILLLYILGLGIEILGVNTGFPFGEYKYGNILGAKIAGTPWIIGVNWILIVVGASQLVFRLFPLVSLWKKSLIVGLLTILMDMMIEPVAIHFDMWQWSNDEIPLSNYAAWGTISTIMSYLYGRITEQNTHNVVIIILIWIVVFFALLNLYV